jgi:hypothetical protein
MSIAKIDQSRSLKRITGLLACPDHELFWVERERSSSRLYSRSSKSAQASGVLYDIADGTIQLLGCFNR